MKSLGIDYGNKYIGVAMGSSDIVAPFTIIENKVGHKKEIEAIAKLSKIVRDEKVNSIVVGIPVSAEGESSLVRDIHVFVHKLKKSIPSNTSIIFIDESYSSKVALDKAIKFGVSRKRRKHDHAIAACEILRRGLEAM